MEEETSAGHMSRRKRRNQKKKNKNQGSIDDGASAEPAAEGDVSIPHSRQEDKKSVQPTESNSSGDLLAFPMESMKVSGEQGDDNSKSSRSKEAKAGSSKGDITGATNQSTPSQGTPKKSSRPSSSTPGKAKTTPIDSNAKPSELRSSEPKIDSFKYWPKADVEEGAFNSTIIKGPLRINPKNYRQCFVPYTDNYIDVYVAWRNRALNGDIVAVHLLEKRLNIVLVDDINTYLEQQEISDRVQVPSINNNSHLEYVRLEKFLEEYPEIVKLLQEKFKIQSAIPDKFLQPVGVIVTKHLVRSSNPLD